MTDVDRTPRTDRDDRLRIGLARLEAAVPPTRPFVLPQVVARRSRRVPLLVAAAVAVALALASVATATHPTFPETPEVALEAALQSVTADRVCRDAETITPLARAAMDAAGYADWSIRPLSGAERSRCIGLSYFSEHHEVVLLPAAGFEVGEVMEAVAEELYTECYDKDGATELVTSSLAAIGIEVNVRADPWGPQAAPIDRIDEVIAHVKAGCFVSAGIQPFPDSEGRMSVDLWGPWP